MTDTITTTTAPTTTAATDLVDAYFAMWNEDDAAARATIIAATWAADGRYVDPLLQADGHDQLSAMVDGVHAQFPGYRFERLSAVDQHHDEVRFAWHLIGADGTIAVVGLDVGTLVEGGADPDRSRLQRITGFFGDLDPR